MKQKQNKTEPSKPILPYPNYIKVGNGLVEISSHVEDITTLTNHANWLLKKNKKLLLQKSKLDQLNYIN